MSRALLVALLPLIGCGGDNDNTDVTGTTDKLTTKVKTGDSGGPPPELDLTGGEALVVMGQSFDSVDTDGLRYANAFVWDAPFPVDNLPGCLFRGTHICTDQYPKAGATYEPDVLPILAASEADAFDDFVIGNTILTRVTSSNPPSYLGTPSSFGGTGGNLQVDGDWAPFSGKDVFPYPTPLAISTPKDGESRVRITGDDAAFDLAWKAGTVGDMYLETGRYIDYQFSGVLYSNDLAIHGLEDNGSFTVTAKDLELRTPIDSFTAVLSRMTNTTVDAAGNDFQVQVRFEQLYQVDYLNPSKEWTQLADSSFIADTCEEAKGLAPVDFKDRKYWGDLSSYSNDFSIQPQVNGEYAFEGNEGYVKVILDKGDEIRIQTDQPNNFAGLYIINDNCGANPLERAYKDITSVAGFEEPIDIIFEAPYSGAFFIGIDSFSPGALFTLEFQLL